MHIRRRIAPERVEDEPEFVITGIEIIEQEAAQIPFSPLITKWQFSGQLVYQNTRKLALEALVCLVLVAGLVVLIILKLK
jgi:hypothetical protein